MVTSSSVPSSAHDADLDRLAEVRFDEVQALLEVEHRCSGGVVGGKAGAIDLAAGGDDASVSHALVSKSEYCSWRGI